MQDLAKENHVASSLLRRDEPRKFVCKVSVQEHGPINAKQTKIARSLSRFFPIIDERMELRYWITERRERLPNTQF